MRRVQVIRDAVTDYLVRVEADRLAEEMRAYVAAMAEASGEFVAETEPHTVERSLRVTTW
jgi:hypothetical protein